MRPLTMVMHRAGSNQVRPVFQALVLVGLVLLLFSQQQSTLWTGGHQWKGYAHKFRGFANNVHHNRHTSAWVSSMQLNAPMQCSHEVTRLDTSKPSLLFPPGPRLLENAFHELITIVIFLIASFPLPLRFNIGA
jgi:hypothetical protein